MDGKLWRKAHRIMPTLSLKPYSGIFSSASGSCRAVPSCFAKNTYASTLGEVGYTVFAQANIRRVQSVKVQATKMKWRKKMKRDET